MQLYVSSGKEAKKQRQHKHVLSVDGICTIGNDHIKVAPSYKRTSISTRHDQPRQEIHTEPLKAPTRKEIANNQNKTKLLLRWNDCTIYCSRWCKRYWHFIVNNQRENETGTKWVTAAVNTDYLTSAPWNDKPYMNTLQVEFTLFPANSVRLWMYTWHDRGEHHLWGLWRGEHHRTPKHHGNDPHTPTATKKRHTHTPSIRKISLNIFGQKMRNI